MSDNDSDSDDSSSTSHNDDHTFEITNLNEDTAFFGELVEDLMQRASSSSRAQPSSLEDRFIRQFKMDGFGSLREPPWGSSRNVDLFFHALALHPLSTIKLENIGMFPYDTRSGTFPIRFLTRLLQSDTICPSLTRLELRDVVLEGMNDEWFALMEALNALPKLEVFSLETCDCTIDFPLEQFNHFNQLLQQFMTRTRNATSNTDGMDADTNGTSTTPPLRRLTLVPAQNYGGDLDPSTLTKLLGSNNSSLRELTLANVGRLNDTMMTTIFKTLSSRNNSNNDDDHKSTSTNLELLDLKNCELKASAVHALSELLSCQHESLTTIKIGLTSLDQNRQRIHDQDDVYKNEAWTVELLTTLKSNRTVTKFVLSSETPRHLTPAATDAYLQVMQLNCSLRDMFITYPNLHFHPNIMNFYAKLNQLGRKRFLQEEHLATPLEWIDMLARVSDDESCLFYFLRLNPLLCSQQQPT